MGSVRAQRIATNGQTRTVLWQGLKPDQWTPESDGDQVIGLGGSLGARINSTTVTLYDAATRKQLGVISLSGVRGAAWSEADHILLLEIQRYDDTANKYFPELLGFRIDGYPPTDH